MEGLSTARSAHGALASDFNHFQADALVLSQPRWPTTALILKRAQLLADAERLVFINVVENQLVLEGRDLGGDFLEPLLDRVVRERDDLVLQLLLGHLLRTQALRHQAVLVRCRVAGLAELLARRWGSVGIGRWGSHGG